MDKWTEDDERSLFITNTNMIEETAQLLLNRMRRSTKGHISLENCMTVYRDKFLELEDQLRQNGISYFDTNWFQKAVSNSLMIDISELSYMAANVINKKLSYLSFLYLNERAAKLGDFILKRNVDFYNNGITELKSFSLEKNLKDILLSILLDDQYYMYKEGDFINFYNEMFEIMSKLGLEEAFLNLDEEMKPLVVKQEQELQDFKVKETVYKPHQR